MDKEQKYKICGDIFCEDCRTDKEITCPRDKDVRCFKCGKELCGYHMAKHLQESHNISITWKGV